MSRYEVVITTSHGEGVDVFDLKQGTHLKGFASSVDGGLSCALLDDEYIVLSQRDRPGLHIWSWRSGRNELKCALQERATCVAVHPLGVYVAAGGVSGKIYVWELSSGVLCRVVDAHYKSVSALAFSQPDGQFLISGGDDSMVNAWLTADLVALPTDFSSYSATSAKAKTGAAAAAAATADAPGDDASSAISAYAEWSDHSLPITHIHCAIGGANGRVLTSSRDRTVKLWDLSSRSLLQSFVFPSSISACVMDAAERWIFASSATGTASGSSSGGGNAMDGLIYQIDLLHGRAAAATAAGAAATANTLAGPPSGAAAAAAAAAAGGAVDWFEPTVFSTSAAVPSAAAPSGSSASGSSSASAQAGSGVITALSISYNGNVLVSAHGDGTCRVWDTASRQALRVLPKLRRSCDGVVIAADAFGFSATAAPSLLGGGHKSHGKAKRTFVPLRRHASYTDTQRTHLQLRAVKDAPAAVAQPSDDALLLGASAAKRARTSAPEVVTATAESALRGFDAVSADCKRVAADSAVAVAAAAARPASAAGSAVIAAVTPQRLASGLPPVIPLPLTEFGASASAPAVVAAAVAANKPKNVKGNAKGKKRSKPAA